MSTVTSNTLDIREIAPRDRHAVIFARFDELPAGESLELINDHDPKPLHGQFQIRSANALTAPVHAVRAPARTLGIAVVCAVLVAFSCATFAATASPFPRESRVPGGVALIPVGVATEPKPAVSRDGTSVWVAKHADAWIAVVGLPLSAAPGEHSVTVTSNGATQAVPFNVKDKRYPVQHVTIKDNAMVEPPAEVIARIEAESAHLKTVRSTWREEASTNAAFVLPAKGRLSGRFGGSRVLNGKPRAPHAGLDVAIGTGTPVVAPSDGVVLDVGDYYFCGKTMFKIGRASCRERV